MSHLLNPLSEEVSHLLNPLSEEEVLTLFAERMPSKIRTTYIKLARKYGNFTEKDIVDIRREQNILSHTSVEEFFEEFLDGWIKDSLETRDGNSLQDLCCEVLSHLTQVYSPPTGDALFVIRHNDECRLVLMELKSGYNWGNSSSIEKTREKLILKSGFLHRQMGMLCTPAVGHFSENKQDQPSFEIKKGVLQLHGQETWRFITGYPGIYKQVYHLMAALIEPWRPVFNRLKALKREELLSHLRHENIDDFFEHYKAPNQLGDIKNTLDLAFSASF